MVYRTGSKCFRFFPCLQETKKTACGIYRLSFLSESLCMGRSTHRAGLGAGAALDAGFRIDFVLAVSVGDRAHGAFRRTGAAADAIVRNFVSHGINLLIRVHVW